MLRELGGFAILSLGILVPLAILVVGGIVVWIAASTGKTIGRKLATGAIAAAIIIVLVLGDEIIGRLYFNRLCDREGYVKVHTPLQLPADYWTREGAPKFIKSNGDLDNQMLDHRLALETRSQMRSKVFRIRSLHFVLVDNATKTPIGEATSFGYFGGWLRSAVALHPTGERCANAPRSYEEAIARAAIKPAPR